MGGVWVFGFLVATFITTTTAQVLNCDFERNFCQWIQVTTDQFDWTRKKGSTPANGTGPSVDHTTGTGSGFYANSKKSNGNYSDIAQLQSPPLTVVNDTGCLQFSYYMFGPGVGELNVYRITNNGTGQGTKIFSIRGTHGDYWSNAKISISTGINFVILIESTRGYGNQGEIAIDDIFYSSARSEACVFTRNCDFEESDLCTWSNDVKDDFDWVINQGTTTSFDTGPIHDFTFGNRTGHYIYIEASLPHQQGDVARLVSAIIPPTGLVNCFTFMYSMYGQDIGALDFYVKTSQSDILVWSLSGDQGINWQFGSFSLPLALRSQYSQIAIESTIGPGYRGDVALDDLKFSSLTCSVTPRSAEPNTSVKTTARPTLQTSASQNPKGTFDCTFEQDFCGWRQDYTDEFDWTRQSGRTGSPGTGPTGDHTKADGTGKYMYIETSAPRLDGDKARIISPDVVGGTYCFQFYYYMYGEAVNSLFLYVMTNHTLLTPILVLKGTQGMAWHLGSLDINFPTVFNIVFEGVAGFDYRGDIVIDDISMTPGTCANVTSQYTQPNTATAGETTTKPAVQEPQVEKMT